MIGAVQVKVERGTHELRLSTRAIVSLERADKASGGQGKIGLIMNALGDDPSVEFVVDFTTPLLNGGKGGTSDEAMDLIDEAGGIFEFMSYLNQAIAAAFPDEEEAEGAGAEPADEAKAGNGKKKTPQK